MQICYFLIPEEHVGFIKQNIIIIYMEAFFLSNIRYYFDNVRELLRSNIIRWDDGA